MNPGESMDSIDSEELETFVEDSPHEEVRAAVSNVDDSDMACVCSCPLLLRLGDIPSVGDRHSIYNHWRRA